VTYSLGGWERKEALQVSTAPPTIELHGMENFKVGGWPGFLTVSRGVITSTEYPTNHITEDASCRERLPLPLWVSGRLHTRRGTPARTEQKAGCPPSGRFTEENNLVALPGLRTVDRPARWFPIFCHSRTPWQPISINCTLHIS